MQQQQVPATFRMAIFVALLSVMAAIAAASTTQILSTSDARLPMSLSMIVSDLEVEGCLELTTACLVTSRGVPPRKRLELLGQILGDEERSMVPEEGQGGRKRASSPVRAAGNSAGLVVGAPPGSDASEVALAACACGGTVVYYPDPTDLSRAEGLFDHLAPAMEKLLARKHQKQQQVPPPEQESSDPTPRTSSSSSQLIVLYETDQDLKETMAVLEREAESVLAHHITEDRSSARPLTVLQDVFDRVSYVRLDRVGSHLLESGVSVNPVDAAARVAETVDWETMFSVSNPLASSPTSTGPAGSGGISAQDLAAARKLGPLARRLVGEALETVRVACEADAAPTAASENGEPVTRLVPDFGPLCHAATRQALDRLQEEAGDAPFWKARVADQIRTAMVDELDAELVQLLERQLDALSEDCFEDFRKRLSKLLLGPNLASDMRQVLRETVQNFGRRARGLVAKQQGGGRPGWAYIPAQQRLESRLSEVVSNRLEAAQASGQYRPLPRRGVTLGLHWLLPKPFGNDYRQEPWMVHAVDTLTYVPSSKKLSDVNPDDVSAGDWRSKVVPSPAGNDMIYLQ
jgi:hypothetical protein